MCKFDLDQSHRKSMQVHARPGQTESQVDPSFQPCVYLGLRFTRALHFNFDSGTAEVLYEECDGTEFELSGNVLDLRYIPDDMEFDQEPHSVATALPASGLYKAPE